MKKTLIALMALAGVACADTAADVNNKISNYIANGYLNADDFTLTYDISDASWGSANILTMSEGWALFGQVRQYLGVEGPDEAADPNGWDFKHSQATNNANTDPFIGTLVTGETDAWLVDLGSNRFEGATVTLTQNTLTVAKDGTTWIDATFDTSISLSNVQLHTNANNVTLIPEPATATLSLLALAGLAARRRRK